MIKAQGTPRSEAWYARHGAGARKAKMTADDLLEWLKATYGYKRTFKVKAVARRLGHANTASVRGGVRALVNRYEVAVAFEKNFYNIYQVVRP